MDPSSGKREKRRQACDGCRQARTRCLPREDGTSAIACPRCVDKRIECITTYSQRGRPRKLVPLPMPLTSAPQAIGYASPPYLVSPIVSTSKRPSLTQSSLSPTAVESRIGNRAIENNLKVQLLEAFCGLPHATHAAHSLQKFLTLTKAHAPSSDFTSSEITLLHAILAVASLASPASVSIATGPSLLQKSAIELQGLDLRKYGQERSNLFESLKKQAYISAKEGEIALECSQDNAAACHLMGFLDIRQKGNVTRPYSEAYMAHIRQLARRDINATPLISSTHAMAAQLAGEALIALAVGKPIPVSTQDLTLFCGTTDTNLGPWLDELRTDWTGKRPMVFDALIPYAVSVVKLAKMSHQYFTSPENEDRPLNPEAVFSYMSALAELRSAVDLFASQGAYSLFEMSVPPGAQKGVQQMIYFFKSSCAILYLPPYRNILRRSSNSGSGETSTFNQLAKFVRQETVMACVRLSEAVRDVCSLVLLTHIAYDRTEEFTQILLSEGQNIKEMGIDVLPSLKWLVQGLKLAGWANIHQEGTIGVTDLHIAIEERKRASWALPTLMPDGYPMQTKERNEQWTW